jgi:hypothetical protein
LNYKSERIPRILFERIGNPVLTGLWGVSIQVQRAAIILFEKSLQNVVHSNCAAILGLIAIDMPKNITFCLFKHF